MTMADWFKDARGLSRIATALERIASAQEEQAQAAHRIALAQEEMMQRAGGGSAFRTGYKAPEGVQGDLISQSDETFAKIEELERREQAGEFISDEEMAEALGGPQR